VEVADDGPGMPSEDAARAFERFWRGDPSRNLPGSGLGLSIVAGIVAAHGGTISMTTAPGAGLKMQIELPLAINQSELGSQIATPASGARKGAIT
jgi:two-component system OmpR family sensor kinase